MTEDKRKARIHDIFTRYDCIFSAFLAVCIQIAMVKVFFIVRFLTNDDTGIQTTYALGYPYQQFVNVFLGYFMCALYKLSDQVSWWYIWSILVEGIGTFLLDYSILKVSKNKLKAYIVIGIFFLCFGSFYFSLIAFTIVPCVIAIGGISLLFTHGSEEFKVVHLIIPVLSTVYAVLHRYETGLEMICFLIIGLIYYVGSIKSSGLSKRILIFATSFGITIVLSFALLFSSNMIKDNNETREFSEFTTYRSVFADFPRDSYEDNSKAYEEAGWSEAVYNLASEGCYLPEEITSDSLTKLGSTVSKSTNKMDIISNSFERIHIKSLQEYVRSLQNYDGLVRVFTSILILLAGSYLLKNIIVKQSFSLSEWCMLMTIGGTSLLVLALWLLGRNILRAYLIIVIPAMVIFVLLLCGKDIKNTFLTRGVILACALLAVSLYGFSLLKSRGEFDDNYREVISYANENSDKLILFSDTSILGLGGETVIPGNLMYWGGTDWNSQFNKRCLNQLNIESVDLLSMVSNDEIYYLASNNDTGMALFLDYYCEKDILTAFKEIDQIGDYKLYKGEITD